MTPPLQINLCRKAKELHQRDLFRKKGVVSVGVGTKTIGGQDTGCLAVVVGVEKKLLLHALDVRDLIPRTLTADYGSVATDVVEVGVVRALANTEERRPCPGGYSVGHPNVTAGTLGAWLPPSLTGLSFPVLLSNNHVLADSNRAEVGDKILQPGRVDGGESGIASLHDFVPINFRAKRRPIWQRMLLTLTVWPFLWLWRKLFPTRQPDPNLVDAAVARAFVPTDIFVDYRVKDIGSVQGFLDVGVGQTVRKNGRTTGLTTSTVRAVDNTVSVRYSDDRIARFDGQILIAGPGFSAGGDSGSVIFDEDNYAVGLLFAGSWLATYANRMQDVARLLDIRS